MDQEKLIDYISGNLEESDVPAVRQWIINSEENRKEFIRLKNIYALSRSVNEPTEFIADFDVIRKRIKTGPREKAIRFMVSSLKYAAIIAVTLLAVHFYNKSTESGNEPEPVAYHQISVPLGQISEFTFADGTRVWLNSGTSLRFPDTFKDSRHIELNGEAYFEVSKNEEKPFLIDAGEQQVKVFGTTFNVRSYEDLDYFETTLIEGSLGIITKTGSGIDMLQPGEQYRLSDSGTNKTIRKVDTHPYEAWKEGKLIFRNRSLGDIALDLERWYNVKISFDDKNIRDYRFSGTILKYKPIDQILEAIKLTSPIRYTIQVHPERSSEIVLYTRK